MKSKFIAILVILLFSGGICIASAEGQAPEAGAHPATDLGAIGTEGGPISYEADLAYPGEIDWFKFAIDSQTADLVLSSDMTKTLRFVLYDENFEYIDYAEDLLKMTAGEGTYLVRVDSILSETGNYTVSISNLLSEAEPNDCLTEGTILGTIANATIISGSLDPLADTDFFLFDIGPDSEGYLEITSETYEADADEEDEFDLWSITEYASIVLYGYNESEGRYLPIESGDGDIAADLSAGRYALRVQSGSTEPISCYVLTLSILDLLCDDEPNDASGEALDLGVLTPGASLTADGCIIPAEDVDYYVLVVEEAMEVAIETFGNSSGDSYLYLYDEEVEEIDYDDDSGEGSWSRIEEELLPGTYYIKVESFWGGESLQYTLKVEGVGGEEKSE